jgi:hypothetical protein
MIFQQYVNITKVSCLHNNWNKLLPLEIMDVHVNTYIDWHLFKIWLTVLPLWLIRDRNTWHYHKDHGLGQKRYADLTYSILAAISFKIFPLGTYTAIQSFFHAANYHGSHFPYCVWVLAILFGYRRFTTLPLQFNFQFRKQSEITNS